MHRFFIGSKPFFWDCPVTASDFGLTDETLAGIVACISRREAVREALIFGSRAKGTFREGSDIDIALKGPSLSHQDVVEIAYELNEEGFLPWHFDLLDYKSIDNPALRDHIDRVGSPIYRKPENP